MVKSFKESHAKDLEKLAADRLCEAEKKQQTISLTLMSNDKFSQEDIFHYWDRSLSGHDHVNQTYPDVVRMWRQFHGCPASGGGIERVFCSVGKQHDTLKKKTRDETLENTLH
jgi:hypothetical protein